MIIGQLGMLQNCLQLLEGGGGECNTKDFHEALINVIGLMPNTEYQFALASVTSSTINPDDLSFSNAEERTMTGTCDSKEFILLYCYKRLPIYVYCPVCNKSTSLCCLLFFRSCTNGLS